LLADALEFWEPMISRFVVFEFDDVVSKGMVVYKSYDVVMEGGDECLIQKVNHMDFSCTNYYRRFLRQHKINTAYCLIHLFKVIKR